MKVYDVKLVLKVFGDSNFRVTHFVKTLLELPIFSDPLSDNVEIREIVIRAEPEALTLIMNNVGDINRLISIDAELAKDRRSQDYLAGVRSFVAELQHGINIAFGIDDDLSFSTVSSSLPASPSIRKEEKSAQQQQQSALYRKISATYVQLSTIIAEKELKISEENNKFLSNLIEDLAPQQLLILLNLLLLEMTELENNAIVDKTFYTAVWSKFAALMDAPASSVPATPDNEQRMANLLGQNNVIISSDTRSTFLKRFVSLSVDQQNSVIRIIEAKLPGEKTDCTLDDDFFADVWQQLTTLYARPSTPRIVENEALSSTDFPSFSWDSTSLPSSHERKAKPSAVKKLNFEDLDVSPMNPFETGPLPSPSFPSFSWEKPPLPSSHEMKARPAAAQKVDFDIESAPVRKINNDDIIVEIICRLQIIMSSYPNETTVSTVSNKLIGILEKLSDDTLSLIDAFILSIAGTEYKESKEAALALQGVLEKCEQATVQRSAPPKPTSSSFPPRFSSEVYSHSGDTELMDWQPRRSRLFSSSGTAAPTPYPLSSRPLPSYDIYSDEKGDENSGGRALSSSSLDEKSFDEKSEKETDSPTRYSKKH